MIVEEYECSAGLSECGKYRYWLRRTWNEVEPFVTFIMLNPSTADATDDDPTIRRCVGFAKSWLFGGLSVVNLFAFRATDPKQLRESARAGVDVVGVHNDAVIRAHTHPARCRYVVAAWGSGGGLLNRDATVVAAMKEHVIQPKCFGLTKGGCPRHPLFLNGRTKLVPFKL